MYSPVINSFVSSKCEGFLTSSFSTSISSTVDSKNQPIKTHFSEESGCFWKRWRCMAVGVLWRCPRVRPDSAYPWRSRFISFKNSPSLLAASRIICASFGLARKAPRTRLSNTAGFSWKNWQTVANVGDPMKEASVSKLRRNSNVEVKSDLPASCASAALLVPEEESWWAKSWRIFSSKVSGLLCQASRIWSKYGDWMKEASVSKLRRNSMLKSKPIHP